MQDCANHVIFNLSYSKMRRALPKLPERSHITSALDLNREVEPGSGAA